MISSIFLDPPSHPPSDQQTDVNGRLRLHSEYIADTAPLAEENLNLLAMIPFSPASQGCLSVVQEKYCPALGLSSATLTRLLGFQAQEG